MKKKILLLLLTFSFYLIYFPGRAGADWWNRPTVRPTQPSKLRPTTGVAPTATPGEVVKPTDVLPKPSPTSSKIISGPSLTPTLRVGEPFPSEGVESGVSPSEEKEDPCAPGKSFTGSYCGWSPDKGQVLAAEDLSSIVGLSYTGSGKTVMSDIIFFTGVLCLLLYAKSKLPLKKSF